MSILPIDIQTILGQLNQAGKIQHNVEHNPINQQAHQGNVIKHKAAQKDHQVSDFENADNQDKIVNPDGKQKQEFSSHSEQKKKEEKAKKKNTNDLYKDPEKGNLIDIKK